MIRVLLLLVVRTLVETAVVFLAVAAVLLIFSFRIGRRLATTSPDPLDRISGRAVQLAAFFPRRAAASPPDREQES